MAETTDEETPDAADSTRQASRRPGLVRSIAHRLAGEHVALPVEGRLGSFDGATDWLNSEPLTVEALRGRVVLVDFWTYTCVNWLRTLPYVRAWSTKYEAAGLTVVGVHTPEFGFERDIDNVRRQVQKLGIEYPVVVDSDYAVWRAFANHFWPALYLADGDGRIRFHHFGEGEYGMTEMAIQQLLVGAGATDVDRDLVTVEPQGLEVAADWTTLRSPETYLGYRQSANFAAYRDAAFGAPHEYTATPQLPLNYWDLSGAWTVTQDAAVANERGSRLAFQFGARDVNLVMGPAQRGDAIPFRVFLDGAAVDEAAGTDVTADGSGVVDEQRCYQLIRRHARTDTQRFEIEFQREGVEAYCFTFG